MSYHCVTAVRATAVAVVMLACSVNRPGNPAPVHDIYYPLGVAMNPNGHFAYVASTNFDLQYNSGWISVLDLDAVKPAATLDVKDPWDLNAFVDVQPTLSFAGLPAISTDGSRLFLPLREDQEMFIFDISPDGSQLTCGTGAAIWPHTHCDAHHDFHLSGSQFSSTLNDTATLDPFATALGPVYNGLPGDFLYVGYLGAGTITVFDVTKNSLTNPDGFAAVTLLGNEIPGTTTPYINGNGIGALTLTGGVGRKNVAYAGTRSLASVNNNGIIPPVDLYYFDPQLAVTGQGIQATIDLTAIIGGTDVKGLTSSPDGSRTYALLATPDTLMMMDSSIDASGTPRNVFLGATPTDRGPSSLVYVKGRNGSRDWIYVACFDDDTISIFDAVTLSQVGEILWASQGPIGLAVAYQDDATYVIATYFSDDAIIEIDATSADPTQHYTRAHIGSPRNAQKKL